MIETGFGLLAWGAGVGVGGLAVAAYAKHPPEAAETLQERLGFPGRSIGAYWIGVAVAVVGGALILAGLAAVLIGFGSR